MELDHVLLAVSDLDASALEVMQRYGLATAPGGRHPGWGTANLIVPLGGSYLEIVAVVDPQQAEASAFGTWVAHAADGELVGWAVRTNELDRVARRLGVPVHEGSRRAGDGGWTRWRMTGVERSMTEPTLPFFIEWAADSRLPGVSAAAHRSAVSGITRLILSGDAQRVSAWIGPHSLPVQVQPGRPAVVAVAIGTAGEDIVIRSAG